MLLVVTLKVLFQSTQFSGQTPLINITNFFAQASVFPQIPFHLPPLAKNKLFSRISIWFGTYMVRFDASDSCVRCRLWAQPFEHGVGVVRDLHCGHHDEGGRAHQSQQEGRRGHRLLDLTLSAGLKLLFSGVEDPLYNWHRHQFPKQGRVTPVPHPWWIEQYSLGSRFYS